jgi:hypothetical protein
MEEQIETRVSPGKVWDAWEQTHAKGLQGKSGQFRYQIVDVIPRESFSMVWKTLFVRMVFHYSVRPTNRGSTIFYDVEMKGLFAWFVRWTLENKIRAHLRSAMKKFASQLEQNN